MCHDSRPRRRRSWTLVLASLLTSATLLHQSVIMHASLSDQIIVEKGKTSNLEAAVIGATASDTFLRLVRRPPFSASISLSVVQGMFLTNECSSYQTAPKLHKRYSMDAGMIQLRQTLTEIETEAEHLLLARNQLVENDRLRNGNREALTALRRKARTTKSSVPSPFEAIMKEIEGAESKPMVREICPTCGNHNSKEHTWMMFPGSDVFVRMPFHAAHTVLDKDQEQLDYDTKKLQSFVKEKSFEISERGALADRISPGIVRSLVTLSDKPK